MDSQDVFGAVSEIDAPGELVEAPRIGEAQVGDADGVVEALGRLRELRELAPQATGIDGLPFARVRGLMVDARTRRAGDIENMSDLRRLATLAAFAIHSWEVSKVETRRSLDLPDRAEQFIAHLADELDSAYVRSQHGLRRDDPVFAVAGGRIDLGKLDTLEEPDSLLRLRALQHAMLPDAELPDLLLEIAARTSFMDGFTHEREPNAQLGDLHISICAVLIAQACNVGYRPLVNESIPALREERLKWVAHHRPRRSHPPPTAASGRRPPDPPRPILDPSPTRPLALARRLHQRAGTDSRAPRRRLTASAFADISRSLRRPGGAVTAALHTPETDLPKPHQQPKQHGRPPPAVPSGAKPQRPRNPAPGPSPSVDPG